MRRCPHDGCRRYRLFSTESGSKRAERVRLFAQPVVVLVIVAVTLIWVFSSGLTATEKETLNASSLFTALW